MFANGASLLPVINSESVASATVSVWRDGGRRKCLSHKLFLYWNTEVTNVILHGRAAGNGDWIPAGWSTPRDRMLWHGLEVWAVRCCSVAAFYLSPTPSLFGALLTELQSLVAFHSCSPLNVKAPFAYSPSLSPVFTLHIQFFDQSSTKFFKYSAF